MPTSAERRRRGHVVRLVVLEVAWALVVPLATATVLVFAVVAPGWSR